MNPYIDSPARQQAAQAAQIAIVLKQLGKLRGYSRADLETALTLRNQRQGSELTFTPELLQGIHKRIGQMIALESPSQPLSGFSSHLKKAA